MEVNYTKIYCEFSHTRKTKTAEICTTLKADLRLAADTKMGAWVEFYTNLRKILSALRKAAKENSEISLVFGRYSYINDYICHERVASFSGFADIADALREFADNSYYWS